MPTPPTTFDVQPSPRELARAEFVSLLSTHGDDLPLAEAAAWIAAEERAATSIDDTMTALGALSEGLYIPEGTPVIEATARLNHHLFVTLGFSGNETDYYSPDNSLLDAVLRDRTGLPITLSLVAIVVADAVGLRLHGVGFPTHFLVSPAESLPRFYIDPYFGGRVLRLDQLEPWFERISERAGNRMPPLSWWLKPVSSRDFLVRINNNLRSSYMRRGDLSGALRCVERLLVLHPEAIEARRDRGLLRIELGQEEEGARDLDEYLAARQFEHALTD